MQCVGEDMRLVKLCGDDAQDRVDWRIGTRIGMRIGIKR